MNSAFLLAQNVSGTVTSETGEVLLGASILVQGTSVGTVTDLDGKFELDYPGDYPFTIEISYTGFTPTEIEITQATNNEQIAGNRVKDSNKPVMVSALCSTPAW